MASKAHTGNVNVDTAINDVVNELNKLQRLCPLTDGILLENVLIRDDASVMLPHKLGRKYRGWIVTRRYANAALTVEGLLLEQSTARAETHLHLRAAGWGSDLRVDIWVF